MAELTAKEKQAEEFKRKFKLLKSKQRKATYLQVLEEALGNVSVAVKTCGITRQAHYNWMDSDPKFRQSVEDIAEVALDFVEGNLMKNVREGKETSTIFYLKTKGKKRGYIETQVNMNLNSEVEDDISKMSDEELTAFLSK